MVLQDELNIVAPNKNEEDEIEKELRLDTRNGPTPYELVAVYYRRLIKNFEGVRAYDLAEDCAYGEFEMKRLDQAKFVFSKSLTHKYAEWPWLRWLGEQLSVTSAYR